MTSTPKVTLTPTDPRKGSELLPPESFGLPKFEDLKVSTITVMVYCNFDMQPIEIYGRLPISDVKLPEPTYPGDRRTAAEKKKISAPYGSIVSVQSKTELRGADIRKKKKVWCMICQPMKVVDGKEQKIITVTQRLRPVPDTDRQAIVCWCSRCEKEYLPGEMKKINHFLNQTTVVLSLGPDQPLLNIMLFKDNFKVAGCKKVDDAMEAIMFLWSTYLVDYQDLWRLKPCVTKKIGPYAGSRKIHPQFAIEPVMTNVDFKLGFPIERPALNRLLNQPEFRHMIDGADYEPTSQTNVSCRIYSNKPEDFAYDWLHIPVDTRKRAFVKPLKAVTWRKMKAPKKFNTFIIFSSSEIILSGRFASSMKAAYEFFVNVVMREKSQIEENLIAPDKKRIDKLRKKIEPVAVVPKEKVVPKKRKAIKTPRNANYVPDPGVIFA